MRRSSTRDLDALLSGRLDPDDAPPELKAVAGLIHAARTPAIASELRGEDDLVAAIAAEMRRSTPVAIPLERRRRRLIGQALSGKVAAATAAVLLSGGAAAAATGSLPGPVQRDVSHGLAHVGISVPAPAAHGSPARIAGSAESNGRENARSSIGVDHDGLCTAYLHPSEPTSTGAMSSASSFSRLSAAAQAKHETIAQYCLGAMPPSAAAGANRGPAHRPTTRTNPSSTRTRTSKSATNTQRHSSETLPTHSGRSTTSTDKIRGRSAANRSSSTNGAGTTTHATTPRGTGSVKGATPSTSTTTTPTTVVPGSESLGTNVGKGVSSAHSH
ncbi:MAG TPA: hypothetical protein VG368_04190 [Acidimicrobiales bacterium]|nr:hypothetical protein [Acidimicrobiales bacterium]